MAAIGSVWRSGTWKDTAWKANTWANAAPPVVVVIPPSPTRLGVALVTTILDTVDFNPTQLGCASGVTMLGALGDDGFPMSTPIVFTAGETGDLTLSFTGADGTPEDLSTATSVTFTMVNTGTGTVAVDAVALTSPSSDGTAVWTRTSLQVGTPGDYAGQGKVIRANGTIGFFPDGQQGTPFTLLRAVGT